MTYQSSTACGFRRDDVSSPIPLPNGLTPTFIIKAFPEVIRLHVNTACNLRCSYPSTGKPFCYMARDRSFNSDGNENRFLESVKLLREMTGISGIRIGGKEPSLHPGLPELVGSLGEMGFKSIKITTNGVAIKKHIRALASLGVSGITVSLQSFSRDMYESITGVDGLFRVLDNIDGMLAHGVAVKVSRILMRETAGDIDAFLAWAHKRRIPVKFYELMKLPGQEQDFADSFMPIEETLRCYRGGMSAAECVFYSSSCKSVWNYRWGDGSRLEVKSMHPDLLARNERCAGCRYVRYCDTGFLGCGFQVLCSGAIRPCLLDGTHDIGHNPGSRAAVAEQLRSLLELDG